MRFLASSRGSFAAHSRCFIELRFAITLQRSDVRLLTICYPGVLQVLLSSYDHQLSADRKYLMLTLNLQKVSLACQVSVLCKHVIEIVDVDDVNEGVDLRAKNTHTHTR